MSAASLFPPLKWAQRQDFVLVTVELQDSANVKLQLPRDGAGVAFSCDVPAGGGSEAKRYACDFDFFAAVSPEESDFMARPRQIEVKLRKKDVEGDFWPRLTADRAKNKSIAIDWARWKDEDDEPEGGDAGDLGDFGLGGGMEGMDDELMQKMTAQFGQGGGGSSGGIPDFGSADGQQQQAAPVEDDDDDMPPLEEDA